MNRPLQLLIGGTLAFWLVVSFPAYRLGGEVGLVTAGLAALLCLLPTAGTLLWASWFQDPSPKGQLLAILGGTGVRMVVVLGAGLALSPFYPAAIVSMLRSLLGDPSWVPAEQLTINALWGWILAFYLFSLSLEVAILVAARNAERKSLVQART